VHWKNDRLERHRLEALLPAGASAWRGCCLQPPLAGAL